MKPYQPSNLILSTQVKLHTLSKSWQDLVEIMATSWQDLAESWIHGNILLKSWQNLVKIMARSWQDHSKITQKPMLSTNINHIPKRSTPPIHTETKPKISLYEPIRS